MGTTTGPPPDGASGVPWTFTRARLCCSFMTSLGRGALVAILAAGLLPAGGVATASTPRQAVPAQPGDFVVVSEGRELSPEVRAAAEQAAAAVGGDSTVVVGGTLGLVGLKRGATVLQAPPAGWRVPMTSIALDVDGANATMSPGVGSTLASGNIVMGQTSAALRGAQAGDTVDIQTWDGRVHTLTIGSIAPDTEVGFTELVFPLNVATSINFARPSSVRIWGFADRDAIEDALDARLADDVRVGRSWGTPGPDSTLPQSTTKALLGEFAVTGGPDPLTVESSWANANIVTVNLPIIGNFRCHKVVAVDLIGALSQVRDAGLAGFINVGDTRAAGGCYYPREIRAAGSTTGGALSRHTWGMALDMNPSTNAMGDFTPAMDERIVDIFRHWGFAWGGGFTIPDGMHFEWVGGASRGVHQLTLAGAEGVADDATAVVLNVTAAEALSDGYLTVYPCDQPRPIASNVNYVAGDTVPNLVVAKLDGDGKVCIYSYAPAGVVVDLAGSFSPSSGYNPVAPSRLIDTRATQTVPAGGELQIDVTATGAVPKDAGAVVLNATATDALADGYLTFYPCGVSVPLASNVNYRRGQEIANLVIAQVGQGGKVCVRSYAEADVVVDVAGWFAAGSDYSGSPPMRLLDTRTTTRVAPGGEAAVTIPGSATVLNLTATDPQADGYLTVYPCGQPVPLASNVNYSRGETIANASVATAGADSKVCVHSYAASHVVVDMTGSFSGGSGFHGITPRRVLDTRTGFGVERSTSTRAGEPTRPGDASSSRPWLVDPEATADL